MFLIDFDDGNNFQAWRLSLRSPSGFFSTRDGCLKTKAVAVAAVCDRRLQNKSHFLSFVGLSLSGSALTERRYRLTIPGTQECID